MNFFVNSLSIKSQNVTNVFKLAAINFLKSQCFLLRVQYLFYVACVILLGEMWLLSKVSNAEYR